MRFYPELSNFVEGVDRAFFFIIGTSIFFLIGLTITIIVFVIRYNKKRHPKPVQMKDNYKLEVAWTIIPLILVLIMFYYGYIGYMPMREAPDDAITIYTEGRMWDWEFRYPNGKKSQDLYVPVEKPVKLLMTSPDVIHSLYIPAFRVKEDLVPGKETMLWFIAHEKGKYEVLCAEYCGLRHSYMMSYAHVMDEADYNTWLADFTPDTTLTLPGLDVMKKNACMGCHSLDGSKLVGPTFKGIYNTERNVLVNGKLTTMVANEKYLEESILNPNAEIVEGYSANLMQSYKNIVTKEELKQMIDYLKQLN